VKPSEFGTGPVIVAKDRFWRGMSLRECLVAGFCAAFIAVTGMFLHVPFHLPGHRVLPLAFFLLLGRACVPRFWTGSAIALASSVLALSIGRDDPTHLAKYLAAGIMADVVSGLFSTTCSVPFGALAGAAIGASWLPVNLLTDLAVGMDRDLAIRHVLLKSASAIIFGAIGGGLVAPVVRRLQASGLVSRKCASDAPKVNSCPDQSIATTISDTRR
jgi:hypothetical protein